MEFIKKNLLAIIVAGAGVLALLFGLILPGATADVFGTKYSIGVFGLAFGSPDVTVEAAGQSASAQFCEGGMSIFGLISIIALFAGIALTIASIFVKDKNLDFIGAILVAVAGLAMFLLLAAGTDVSMYGMTGSFGDYYKEFSLGAGAIIYALIAIIGGGFGILNKFKKII